MNLDGELIARRRRDLGLTVRALGRAVGVTAATIGRIEREQGHGALSLRTVGQLADCLAVEPVDLIATEPDRLGVLGEGDLPARLGALLRETDVGIDVDVLAEATGSTLDEIDDALEVLDGRLRPCGLRLHRIHADVGIRLAIDDTTPSRLSSPLTTPGGACASTKRAFSVRSGRATRLNRTTFRTRPASL